jgi:hypothetical protein
LDTLSHKRFACVFSTHIGKRAPVSSQHWEGAQKPPKICGQHWTRPWRAPAPSAPLMIAKDDVQRPRPKQRGSSGSIHIRIGWARLTSSLHSMPKITFIGAGSLVFTRNLCSDILLAPSLQACTIELMDIDRSRLEQSRQIVQSIVDRRNLRAKVKATTERKTALRDADYVITTFQQGGLEA